MDAPPGVACLDTRHPRRLLTFRQVTRPFLFMTDPRLVDLPHGGFHLRSAYLVFVRRASVFAMRNHARALVVEVAASWRARPGVGRSPGVLPHPPGLAHHARSLPSMGSVCV